MITIKLIFLATIFILTQGIVFADKFKENKLVLALGGLFAVLSSVLLSNEVKGIVGETNGVTIVIYLLLGGVTLFSFLHILKMQQVTPPTQEPLSQNDRDDSEIESLKKKIEKEKLKRELERHSQPISVENSFEPSLEEEEAQIRELEKRAKALDEEEKKKKKKIALAQKRKKLEKELKEERFNEYEKSKAIKEGKIVVIDGLMYQNTNFDNVGLMTHKEAEDYAKNLRLGGIEGWRLPTREELHKIGNIKFYKEFDDGYDQWFNKNKHKRVRNSEGDAHFVKEKFLEAMPIYSWFWTSEKRDSLSLWVVGFHNGYDRLEDLDFSYYVLCVQ